MFKLPSNPQENRAIDTPLPLHIAVIGAECTGKTTLVSDLSDAFAKRGKPAVFIPEYLREWCALRGRTPLQEEQHHIAQTQSHALTQYAMNAPSSVVISDSSALMTALYSHYYFGDQSLLDHGLKHQSRFQLTFLTGLDVPWVEDGIQRDHPQARLAIDTLVRQTLLNHQIPFTTVYGTRAQRLNTLLTAVEFYAKNSPEQPPQQAWQWCCEKCSDASSERQLFSALIADNQ